jgi:hypothetical protein
MMGSFRSTPELAAAGINRQSHLVFNAEGYLIRVGSLLDRALKVVDAVFHLGNSERNCSWSVVPSNRRVAHHTEIIAALKALKKLTDRYQGQRNEVVHSHPYLEQRLRYAEMYDLVSRSRRLKGDPDVAFLERERDTFLREFLKEKRAEFQSFNVEVAHALRVLFDALEPRYVEEARVIKTRIGRYPIDGTKV